MDDYGVPSRLFGRPPGELFLGKNRVLCTCLLLQVEIHRSACLRCDCACFKGRAIPAHSSVAIRSPDPAYPRALFLCARTSFANTWRFRKAFSAPARTKEPFTCCRWWGKKWCCRVCWIVSRVSFAGCLLPLGVAFTTLDFWGF